MLRVILVDDEPSILEDLEIMLGSCKEVEVAATYTDPVKALEGMEQHRADGAFLDIDLPGMNGIELAEQLSARNPELQVVFVTAYNHYAAQAFEVNAIDYLLKPIRPERLEQTVNKLLKRLAANSAPAPSSCRIRCLGSFEISVDHQVLKWNRNRARELFAYFLQHEGKWISKYKLCDDLWPDSSPERAQTYLQVCLHALRKNLKDAGKSRILLAYSNGKYALTVSDVDWDVRQFEEAYQRFKTSNSPEAAKQALSLYGGEYLESEDWLWSALRREAYICQYEELMLATEDIS